MFKHFLKWVRRKKALIYLSILLVQHYANSVLQQVSTNLFIGLYLCTFLLYLKYMDSHPGCWFHICSFQSTKLQQVLTTDILLLCTHTQFAYIHFTSFLFDTFSISLKSSQHHHQSVLATEMYCEKNGQKNRDRCATLLLCL